VNYVSFHRWPRAVSSRPFFDRRLRSRTPAAAAVASKSESSPGERGGRRPEGTQDPQVRPSRVSRFERGAASKVLLPNMIFGFVYALFTLVGIAGEDDLDAPDLNVRPSATGAPNGRKKAVGFRAQHPDPRRAETDPSVICTD
jgi:hypothetical protein